MDWKGEAVMNKRKKLPIGIESFEEMRKEDFYYVKLKKIHSRF